MADYRRNPEKTSQYPLSDTPPEMGRNRTSFQRARIADQANNQYEYGKFTTLRLVIFYSRRKFRVNLELPS